MFLSEKHLRRVEAYVLIFDVLVFLFPWSFLHSMLKLSVYYPLFRFAVLVVVHN